MVSDTLSHLLRENYLIARLRGKRSKLLERQQLIALSEAKSQTEIIGLLAEGPYGPELSKLGAESSTIETERAVRLGFADSIMGLIRASQGDTHDFLVQYRERFDAYSLASLVVFKAQGKAWEEYLTTRLPISLLKEQELHRFYNLDDLSTIAHEGGDRHLVERLKGLSMTDIEGEKASLVRDVINGWGEERLYKYIDQKLSGPDRGNCLPIVGSAIDLANVTIIVRSKIIGASGVKDHLIPSYWKLNQPAVDQLLTAPDAAQALDSIAGHEYYGRILGGARQKYEESKSLSFIEVALRRYQLDLSRRIFLGFPYSVGIMLAFLTLKENEARNLAAVLAGVSAGMPTDDLRSLLAVRE